MPDVVLRVNKEPVLLRVDKRPVVLQVKAARGNAGRDSPPGFGSFIGGTMEANELILRYVAKGRFPLDPDMCIASVNGSNVPGTDWVGSIQINGVVKGSVTIPDGETDGVWLFDLGVDYLEDTEILEIYAPTPASLTVRNLTIEIFA